MTSTARAPALVVAGLSVRVLAEAARAGGFVVIALDLFGDRDTRRASREWRAIGDPAHLRIDPAALRTALAEAALLPDVAGWVPAGGFEDAPDLLEAGGPALPCLGTTAGAVRRLRRPAEFFGVLDRLGLAHPPITHAPPAQAEGWLAKRGGGCGGLHVRSAARRPLLPARAARHAHVGAVRRRWRAGHDRRAQPAADRDARRAPPCLRGCRRSAAGARARALAGRRA
jgi:predicted ATP-grasp superfamily ATP-dependent carboligase